MRILHVSKQTYRSGRGELGIRTDIHPGEEPAPACGQNDGVPVIRRGRGAGLLHDAALTIQFHCEHCIDALREYHPH